MNFLLVYRTMPHTTTGIAPCVLFLNRDLRTCCVQMSVGMLHHNKQHRKLIIINAVEPGICVWDKEC